MKITLAQLEEGKVRSFEERLSPEVLEPHEADLHFPEEVIVEGEAYRAGDAVVCNFVVRTVVQMSCAICNEGVMVAVNAKEKQWAQPIEWFPEGEIDLTSTVREALFLALPWRVECGGDCPRRKDIERFMRQEKKEEGYHPFKDLES